MSDMSDQLYGKVSSELDPLKRILSKIPGFDGYVERQSRRDADKLLRETVAARFEEQVQRVSALQRDFISQGEIGTVDDLEAAAIKLRTFADRVRRATYGYSGLFDAVKIGEEELAQLYQFDAELLALPDEIERAVKNVAASIGTDGLPAAIRHLVTLARQADETFDRRNSVFASTQGSME
jgi:hypothetical protein